MTLGALALKLRQKYGHGLRAAWYRDHVRPKILNTPPVTGTTDKTCEIHVLTCQGDWLSLVWTLKSFYLGSGRRYALCIHEDGSLDQEAKDTLARHFPDARLITRKEADAWAQTLAGQYPRIAAFRSKHALSLKITDFMPFLEGERLLVFDSDLLFFTEPTELLRRVEDPAYAKNSFNEDVDSAYAISPELARAHLGIDLIPRFNSGLGLAQRDSIRLDWLEEFLGVPGMLEGHFWRIEQTLFALCSCRHGVELLPAGYRVSLQPGMDGKPMRHYVGSIRHLMYAEGMRWLARETAILDAG